jgi:hypothetical protein
MDARRQRSLKQGRHSDGSSACSRVLDIGSEIHFADLSTLGYQALGG